MWIKVFTFALVAGLASSEITGECPDDYCDSVQCETQPHCDVVLKEGSSCGCCDLCVNYLKEGDACSPGTLYPPPYICAPGLSCNVSGFCSRKNSTCHLRQDEWRKKYDEGEVGMYSIEPECDPSGQFKAQQCISGSVCFCVDKDGQRISGEDSFVNRPLMDCECARYVHEAKKKGGADTDTLRCLPNGSFAPLQCASDDACFCMNGTKVSSEVVHQKSITSLKPCCNSSFVAECYDGRRNPCDQEKETIRMEAERLRDNKIEEIGRRLPACTEDGYYQNVRIMNSSTVMCVTPEGHKIDNFVLERDSSEVEDMDCNCARALNLLKDSISVKPECCRNGNYRPFQCRGAVCYCVDEYGQQDGGDIPIEEAGKEKTRCRNEGECGDWGEMQ